MSSARHFRRPPTAEAAPAGARRRLDGWALAVALVTSALVLWGAFVMDRMFSDAPSIVGKSGIASLALLWPPLAAVAYALVRLALRLMDGLADGAPGVPGPDVAFRPSRGDFLRALGLVLLCWLPVLALRFPGNVDFDTLSQIIQPNGLAVASDHHPWLDTLVFTAFWNLGRATGVPALSVLPYAAIQVLVTAAVLALALVYLAFAGVPRPLRRLATAFVCLFPAVPVFAQTMMKDSLFAWLWVAFLLLYAEVIRTRGAALRRRWALPAMGAVMLLCMLTKKTGVYLLAICLPFALARCGRGDRARLAGLAFAPALALFLAWQAFALPALGVRKGSSGEMLSVPAVQTASYVRRHKAEMGPEEWAALEGVYVDPQTMGDTYNPARADSSKGRWRGDATREELLAYARWYVGALVRDPASFALSTGAITLPLYYPDSSTFGRESLLFYPDSIETAYNPDGFHRATITSYVYQESVDELNELIAGPYRTDSMARASAAFSQAYLTLARAFPIPFSKALYALWLPLLCLAWCARRGRRAGLCLLVPFGATLLSLLLGPIALPRYFAAVLYAIPLLTLVTVLDGPRTASGRE